MTDRQFKILVGLGIATVATSLILPIVVLWVYLSLTNGWYSSTPF